MKIVVLGATGGTGLELIKRSIEMGHNVTAYVRNPEPLRKFGDKVDVVQGDLLDSSSLSQVMRGKDAVLSGFGPRVPIAKTDAHLLRDFATVLITSLERSGVSRVVIISTAFLFKDSIIPPTYLLGKLLFPSVVADAADLEGIILRSNLDWTIVRPPQLTDLGRTGRYRERIGHLPRFGFKISRADVADYFVNALPNRALVHKIVGISN